MNSHEEATYYTNLIVRNIDNEIANALKIRTGHHGISAITVGELRRGIDLIGYPSDLGQARTLETWLQILMNQYAKSILDVGKEDSQIWVVYAPLIRKMHWINRLPRLS